MSSIQGVADTNCLQAELAETQAQIGRISTMRTGTRRAMLAYLTEV